MTKARKKLMQHSLLETTQLMEAVAMKAPVKSKIEKDFPPEVADKIKRNLKDKKVMDADKEEEKERRKRIVKIKNLAKEMEQGNNSKVILFPSYSRKSDELSWYKMGEFSALYYVHRMAVRMGRTAKVTKDTDRFAKMHVIASVRDAEAFVERAMQLGDFERYEKTLDGFYVLYLKRALSDDEIGVLRKTEETKRQMMHNVLKPRKANAAVYQAILMLDRQVLPRASRMENKGYVMTIGHGMVDAICEITRVYFDYADGVAEPESTKLELIRLVNKLRASVALLGELNVWGYDVATAVGENLAKLRELITELK